MLASYAQHYEELWNRHWWWQARKQFVLRMVRRLAAERTLGNILDIGCGNGLFFDELSTFGSVRGIEPDAGLVTEGKWRASIEIRKFDRSFAPPQPLDLILMLDVLEHIPDDAAAVSAVREILAPGGFFVLTVPALMSLWSMHDVANQHFRRYRKSQLKSVLQTAGLEVLQIGYFFGWSVAPMLARRLLAPGKGTHMEPAKYEVHVPPSPVNSAMYALTRVEQSFTPSCGLPLGSSLFALARRHNQVKTT